MVDKDLKVYGIKNLRVIDASVFPVIPDCRIQNAVYMIAEKVSSTSQYRVVLCTNNKTGRRYHQGCLPGLVLDNG